MEDITQELIKSVNESMAAHMNTIAADIINNMRIKVESSMKEIDYDDMPVSEEYRGKCYCGNELITEDIICVQQYSWDISYQEGCYNNITNHSSKGYYFIDIYGRIFIQSSHDGKFRAENNQKRGRLNKFGIAVLKSINGSSHSIRYDLLNQCMVSIARKFLDIYYQYYPHNTELEQVILSRNENRKLLLEQKKVLAEIQRERAAIDEEKKLLKAREIVLNAREQGLAVLDSDLHKKSAIYNKVEEIDKYIVQLQNIISTIRLSTHQDPKLAAIKLSSATAELDLLQSEIYKQ